MTDRPASAKAARRASFGFIFALALINSVSFGIMIPILPNLVKEFTGGDTASASEWNMVFGTVWGLMQFVCGPILGLMSDRWGRRPVLLISLFGLAIDFLFMAFAPTLWWLLVGRVLNGMTAASFSTANAYLADVTPPDQRAKVFGWMSSAFSFGFIIGPAIGGMLGDIDLRLPFLASAALTAVNWLYGLLVLPESLPPERRAAKFDWRRANPIGGLILLKRHPGLLGLAGIGFLFQLSHMVFPSIFVLYIGYRYGWGPDVIGWVFMVGGVMGVIVQSFLVGPIVKRIGERNTVLAGAALGAAGMFLYGSASTGAAYLMAIPVVSFVGLMMPGLQGLMTRRVLPSEQGQLQGANQSLTGIAAIFGPLIFGETFAWSIRHPAVQAPGLAVYLSAAMLVAAFLLALAAAKQPRPEPKTA